MLIHQCCALSAFVRVAVCIGALLASSTATLAEPGDARPTAEAPKNAENAPAEPAKPKFVVSRRALGEAYIELERLAINTADITRPEVIVSVNRGFDSALPFFFASNFPAALERIHAQSRKLFSGKIGPALEAYDFRLSPRYVQVGVRTEVKVSVRAMYATGGPPEPRRGVLRAACTQGGGEVLITLPDADGSVVETSIFISPTAAGECMLSFGDDMGARSAGVIRAVPRSLDLIKRDLLRRLREVAPTPALKPAIAAATARAEILTDAPSDNDQVSVVVDFAILAADVEREVRAIERGEDPYRDVPGDFWTVFTTGDAAVPMRLVVPEPLGGERSPRPLIIAVHGAGGDENLFTDAYGAGNLKRLALDNNAILVSPRASMTAFFDGYADAIIASVSRWHDIDPRRIYLVGHSLGGATVAAWARSRPTKFAAVASVAGVGNFGTAKALPPTLTIAGELDPLARPDRIKADADKAKAAGLNIEYREYKNYGHTLVMGRAAPDIVAWLLTHTAPAPSPESPPPTAPDTPKP